ncbi:MAG: preprotein translocase subunit SecE [Hyphomicrobiales bacterium]|nr:preprotein translocase subunit SecE [Hyphomicrobiales bacterium]
MMASSPAQFTQEVKQEFSRVTWPTRKEAVAATMVVLLMSIIAAVFFLFADWVVSSLIRWFLGV